MSLNTERAVAAELLSSSVCNAACTYCFIPKVPSLKEFLPPIKNKLGGGYIEDLKRSFGENLECLTLWGTEPLTTLSQWNDEIPNILKAFPKLNKLGFSTNMFRDPQILMDFINYLPKNRENLNFDIQISIDGPPEITDNNRGIGATKRITEHFIKLLELLNNVDLGQLTISFCFKSTIDIKNIEWFNESPSRLWGYFFFFDMLIASAVKTNKNKNVHLNLNGIPSLAVPGFFTVENGISFSNFCKNLKEIEYANFHRNIFLYIHGDFNHYEIQMKRILKYGNEFHEKQTMFTCSAGDSNFQLDCYDNVHMCHRTLFYESKEFVNALIKNEYGTNRPESASAGMIENVQKNWVVKNNDQKEINRFMYNLGNYHHFALPKLNLVLPVIFELAYSGQILDKYLDRTEASWLGLFIMTVISCPAENILNNGTIHLPSLSLLRLFGNGAFEHIKEYAIYETRNDYIK